MKLTVTIARYFTGLLFIFSGLIKGIDPRGLAYKMQEFFEAWANAGFMKSIMEQLNHYALGFSVLMITLEVLVGLGLILGWQRKLTTWLLLALMLFFTFLTSYVLFSGKIKACGCFGDCVPLTPNQTFTKDIILLVLALLLLVKCRYITALAKPAVLNILMLIGVLATLGLQFYVMRHLPLKDCLPFKKGNNIIELRKMPADAVADQYAINFIYQKDGQQKEFAANALPDSSWEYVDRLQTLVQAGKNNVPLINDFSFTTAAGNDSTEAILQQTGIYYFLIAKDLKALPTKFEEDLRLTREAVRNNIAFYVVASNRAGAQLRYNGAANNAGPLPVFSADATAIKTAARTDMVLYKMQGPVVLDKWSWADFDEVNF